MTKIIALNENENENESDRSKLEYVPLEKLRVKVG